MKSWLIGKDSDAGRDWGQEEKGTTEDEMAGWHHRLNGLEFEWTPGVRDGQGGLACCNSWGCKESDTTERLNWTDSDSKEKETKFCFIKDYRLSVTLSIHLTLMETYITICEIDSQGEFVVWLRKLKQALCINLEGWDREGDEREVQKRGDICIPMADSCWGLTENSKIL